MPCFKRAHDSIYPDQVEAIKREGLEGLRDMWAAVADLPLPDVEEHRQEEVFGPILFLTTSVGTFLRRGGGLEATSRAQIDAAVHWLETVRPSLNLADQARLQRVIELAQEMLRKGSA